MVIVTMVVMISFFYAGKINGNYLPITIVFINGITLVAILVDKAISIDKDVISTQHVSIPEIADQSNTEPSENVISSVNNTVNAWNIAMYNRFAERWQILYDKIEYPTDKATKAEISVLSWEISSLTMDYLMMVNESPNLLERHKESVNAVICGLGYNEMGLKPFFEDPTTVPAKVLAVYNTLSPQVAARQLFETNIFGYYVEIPQRQ